MQNSGRLGLGKKSPPGLVALSTAVIHRLAGSRMAPARAVFFGRNVFERCGQLWGPSRRLERRLDAMPTGQLVCSKWAATRANKPIVDALLQVLALAGWRLQRWLTLRACCCAARDALPLLLTDDSLQDFCDSRPPPLPAGQSSGRSARAALSCSPRHGWGWRPPRCAWTGGASLQNFLESSRRAAVQSGVG